MLEVSTALRSPSKADQRGFVVDHVGGFPTSGSGNDCCNDFMIDDNLLDYIDFSCEVPSFFDADGDILPDLEVDPTDLLADFSSPETTSPAALIIGDDVDEAKPPPDVKHQQEQQADETTTEQHKAADENNKDEAAAADGLTTTEDSAGAAVSATSGKSSSVSAGSHHSKKKASAAAGKNSNNNGKRKVDWTPELHRRFVQAVEQLGIDKAVPSRILEIMGIECLTRHNIASHLQKYRSHRKHLMAREAEAATWAQKRRMYAPAARKVMDAAAGGGAPWVVPTIGFPPPPAAMAPPPFCRPLHVWGHPPTAVDAAPPPATTTMLPVWPRHLAPPRPWAPVDPASYWQHHQYNVAGRKWPGGPLHHQAATMTQGTPCVAPTAMVPPPARPFPVVPPHHPGIMYRPPPMTMVPAAAPPHPPPPIITTRLAELQLQLDTQPSKESIDSAIGDVLVKPWLPLPLGLKPPSMDSVMSELHKQGIPKIPPSLP